MPMNGAQLGNEIWEEIRPYLDWDGENPPQTITGAALWQKIGAKIVAHITANGKAVGVEAVNHTTHTLDLS